MINGYVLSGPWTRSHDWLLINRVWEIILIQELNFEFNLLQKTHPMHRLAKNDFYWIVESLISLHQPKEKFWTDYNNGLRSAIKVNSEHSICMGGGFNAHY